MKKTLLLMILFCAALNAAAQSLHLTGQQAAKRTQQVMKAPKGTLAKSIDVPRDTAPTYDPTGTDELYIMSYTDNDGFMESSYTNGKVTVRTAPDGQALWFNSLTPGGNRETKGSRESWIKGTRAGDKITIKAGQVLVKNEAHTLYLQIAHLDDYGTVTEFESAMTLTVGADGKITQDNAADHLVIYKDSEEDGYFSSFGMFNGISLMPMGELVRWNFPEGVTPDTYVLQGSDLQGGNATRLTKVAFDGDKCYIAGLAASSPDEVYEGSVHDGQVHIKAGQIVKDADLFFFRLMPIVFDADYNAEFKQNFVFQLSTDRHTLTLQPKEVALCETDYNIQNIKSGVNNISLTYYPGDHAAKPATPEILKYDEANTTFYVKVPQNDIDGNYINADKLVYRFYVDGEPYTFKPSTYVKLDTDMTDIPYNFADNYDFYSNPGYKVVCFYDLHANYVEVESAYTVDGVTNVSDRARYNFVSNGIHSTTESGTARTTTYANLAGQRLLRPVPGSVVLVTTTRADGTRVIEKRVMR